MNNCLALGSVVFSGHDGLQRGCTALDGCAALSWRCCEVQHELLPCIGQCFGKLASSGPPPAWLEVGELREAALALSCLGQCLGLWSAGTVSGGLWRR